MKARPFYTNVMDSNYSPRIIFGTMDLQGLILLMRWIEGMDDLYTIGQVAAICNISVQGLRYYDKIGLLKPSALNGETRYRYYANRDIHNIRIIQDLKELDFSLEEIDRLIKKEDMDLIADALERKQKELTEKIQNFHSTLERIDNRLYNINLHGHLDGKSFEDAIEIKNLPDRRIAYCRYFSDCSHPTLVKRFYELDGLVKENHIITQGFRMAIYHDYLEDFNPAWCDLEVGVFLSPDLALSQGDISSIRIIPGGLYATALYKGEYQGQCEKLVRWIQQKGYEIIGPGYEIYMNSFLNTRFPVNYVTEVQFPIR